MLVEKPPRYFGRNFEIIWSNNSTGKIKARRAFSERQVLDSVCPLNSVANAFERRHACDIRRLIVRKLAMKASATKFLQDVRSNLPRRQVRECR
jgi:hypothetical protein